MTSQEKSPKQAKLDDEHETLKGICHECHVITELRYDTKDHLKCAVCHSMNIEILYKEIY